jgi:carbamoyl-phosphate synthase large subunit
MKTILVSGASGIVGYGCLQSLRMASEKYRLVGTSVYAESIASAFCDVFERAPYTWEEGYLDWLNETIEAHEVDLIIPSIEVDLFLWNSQRRLIARRAKVALNNPDLIELCGDKWLFYEALRNACPEFAIPSRLDGSFEELSEAFGLPFILKPRKGYASKGIVRIEDEAGFSKYRERLGELMAQPIVGNDGEEYTTSAFFDSESKLKCLMTLRRKLSKDGYTEIAFTVDEACFERAVERLRSAFLPMGPTNFQFRKTPDGLKLLEINPRISSATSIRAKFGYNEAAMCAEYYLSGRVPKQPPLKNGRAIRYVEDYIVYDRSDC